MDATLQTVGTLLSADQHRDAVHFALAPMIAAETLRPGQHIGLAQDTEHAGSGTPLLGIVDPFLTRTVQRGERFWMFLYPATITSLRHEWIHPAFAPSPAQAWMEQCAGEVGMTYGAFMEFLRRGAEERDYLSFGADESSASLCNSRSDEIWDHYEEITGAPVRHRPYFSCAC